MSSWDRYSTLYVDEDAPLGELLAPEPQVYDVDSTSFRFAGEGGGGGGGPFAVDNTTGALRVRRALDFETARNYTVAVRVWDGGIAGAGAACAPRCASATATAFVVVVDVNEPPTVRRAARRGEIGPSRPSG